MGNHQRIDERMAIRPVTNVYGVKDVQSQAFVVELAKYLKRSGKIVLPKYVDYVKTGVAKELAPSTLIGSTFAPPLWPAAPTCARESASEDSARSTRPPRRRELCPSTSRWPAARSFATLCSSSRPWACWRRIPREAVASPRRDASRSTVLPL